MPKPRRRQADAMLAAASLLFECGVAVLIGAGLGAAAAAFHGLICGLLGGVLLHRDRHGMDLRNTGLLAITTAIAGPLGPAGTLLKILLLDRFPNAGPSPEQWLASVAPERGAQPALAPVSGHEPQPLIDILTRGTEYRKQAVVALVSRHFRPSLAPVLQRALDDPSNTVRVQAATALTHIENTFRRRALELAAAHEADPGDASLYLAQARLYDDHAHTGLLDGVRQQESRDRALAWYQRYLNAVPGNLEARTALARLLVRQRDYLRASELLEELAQDAAAPEAVHSWRLEAAFELGHWDTVRSLARCWNSRCQSNPELPVELRQAVALWAGAA